MSDALALDLRASALGIPSQAAVVARGFADRVAQPAALFLSDKPCRKGSVEKRTIRFGVQPDLKRTVAKWVNRLQESHSLADLPAAGRALVAVYQGLWREIDRRTGRCDPALKTVAKAARYKSRTTALTWLKWLEAHGVITVMRTWIKTPLPNGQYMPEQDTNVYVFNHPSQWRGVLAPAKRVAVETPGPTSDDLGLILPEAGTVPKARPTAPTEAKAAEPVRPMPTSKPSWAVAPDDPDAKLFSRILGELRGKRAPPE